MCRLTAGIVQESPPLDQIKESVVRALLDLDQLYGMTCCFNRTKDVMDSHRGVDNSGVAGAMKAYRAEVKSLSANGALQSDRLTAERGLRAWVATFNRKLATGQSDWMKTYLREFADVLPVRPNEPKGATGKSPLPFGWITNIMGGDSEETRAWKANRTDPAALYRFFVDICALIRGHRYTQGFQWIGPKRLDDRSATKTDKSKPYGQPPNHFIFRSMKEEYSARFRYRTTGGRDGPRLQVDSWKALAR